MNIIYMITYLPHVGTSYPKYYIGSKFNYAGEGSYMGSPSSSQVFEYTSGDSLKEWWKSRVVSEPDNFKFEIISEHDCTPKELVEFEKDVHIKYDVLSSEYFNQSIATSGWVSVKRSESTKAIISHKTREFWKTEEGQLKKDRMRKRNSKLKSAEMRARWEDPEFRNMKISEFKKPNSKEHNKNISESKLKSNPIEYNGSVYYGWKSLLESEGISKHMYRKYYKNGIDPITKTKINSEGSK